MTSRKPFRRKKTYLGWETHGRLVARLALLWGVYHLTLWEALCTRQYIQYLTSLRDVETRMSLLTFFEGYLQENAWMVMFSCVFAMVVLWDAVRLTHRVVGPLKHAENVLYAMADGESVHAIKFREGDLAEGFERALNAYLSSPHAAAARACYASAELPEPAESQGPMKSVKAPPVPLDDEHLAELSHELQHDNRLAAAQSG